MITGEEISNKIKTLSEKNLIDFTRKWLYNN